MKRSATATWTGNLKQGKGTLTTESGVLKSSPFSFSSRFEDEPATNPEELIGAAHAGCFTMALSAAIEKSGFIVKKITTDAQVSLVKDTDTWNISEVELNVKAHVPEITAQQFQELITHTANTCPVSKLLKAKIIVESTLDSK